MGSPPPLGSSDQLRCLEGACVVVAFPDVGSAVAGGCVDLARATLTAIVTAIAAPETASAMYRDIDEAESADLRFGLFFPM